MVTRCIVVSHIRVPLSGLAQASQPKILTRKPATVANNIQKLQTHSFTSAQAVKIYASHPTLAGCDWNSPLGIEKLEYLTLIFQLTTGQIASQNALLGASLEQKLGPRAEFLYRSRAVPSCILGVC